jgi:hypothetical protein
MKADVLAAVADRAEADAVEVADAVGLTYEAAAMALLRAYRGGLLARIGAPGLQAFRYSLTDKGRQRLEYFDGTRPDAARHTYTPNSRSGDPDMRGHPAVSPPLPPKGPVPDSNRKFRSAAAKGRKGLRRG